MNQACIRDPFERFRAFHAFVAARPNHPAYPGIGELSLGEAVELSLHQRERSATNYLTRYLGGGHWRPFARVRAHLENRYLAVVPYNHVGRLVSCVANAFDVPPPKNERRNVQSSYPLSEEGRELFVAHNSLDYQVLNYVYDHYEHWLDEFPCRLQRMSA